VVVAVLEKELPQINQYKEWKKLHAKNLVSWLRIEQDLSRVTRQLNKFVEGILTTNKGAGERVLKQQCERLQPIVNDRCKFKLFKQLLEQQTAPPELIIEEEEKPKKRKKVKGVN